MLVQMMEVPYGNYKNIHSIFIGDTLETIVNNHKNDCYELSWEIKNIMNANGILAEIIVFKNGNAFVDGGILVFGHRYTYHAVVLMGEWIMDPLHTDDIIRTKDYILNLQKDNSSLRIDQSMSTGWYTEEGYPCIMKMRDLIEYKY